MRFVLSIVISSVTGTLALSEPSRVQDSPLPSGQGLGTELGLSPSIPPHPQVIFSEDFESSQYAESWDEVRDQSKDVLSRVRLEGSEAMFGHSLKVTARLGRNTGGGLTKWFSSSEKLFIRFYSRFDQNCDYVHHFVTLRANKSLIGKDRWSGFGGAGLRPDGKDRFSTALEPWGNWGRWPAPGQWNFYSYLHEMVKSPDGKYWGNSFRVESQPNIEKGKWICLEFMLRHNTPAEANGEQAFWVDGQLMGHWKGFNWRQSASLMANALTLESYVTDRWTKNKENVVYFDNLVIARQYVGPMIHRDGGD